LCGRGGGGDRSSIEILSLEKTKKKHGGKKKKEIGFLKPRVLERKHISPPKTRERPDSYQHGHVWSCNNPKRRGRAGEMEKCTQVLINPRADPGKDSSCQKVRGEKTQRAISGKASARRK